MIEISKSLNKVYLQPFSIRTAYIEEAVNYPDVTQNLEFGDLGINLYMKTSDKSSPPTTLIILERVLENDKTMIDAVYKTYLEPLGISKDIKPFDILKILAERFGISLKVLNKYGKFIGKETMPIPPGIKQSQIVQINEKCPMITSFYFRIKDKQTFEVAFAFAIKAEEYKSWLSSCK